MRELGIIHIYVRSMLDHGLTKGIHDKRREKERVDRDRRRESSDRDAPAPPFGAHRVDQRAHKHVIRNILLVSRSISVSRSVYVNSLCALTNAYMYKATYT